MSSIETVCKHDVPLILLDYETSVRHWQMMLLGSKAVGIHTF